MNPIIWRQWSEIEVGHKVCSQELTVTEAHLVNWSSLTGDWFELHSSAEYARGTLFGQRIAHGPLTFALAMGLMYMSGQVNKDWGIAWLGAGNMRLPKPVFIGDTIHVEASVVSKRETRRPGRGIVVLLYDVKNQRGDSVLRFESTMMARMPGSEDKIDRRKPRPETGK